jgi:hypothetical protein
VPAAILAETPRSDGQWPLIRRAKLDQLRETFTKANTMIDIFKVAQAAQQIAKQSIDSISKRQVCIEWGVAAGRGTVNPAVDGDGVKRQSPAK